LTHFPANLLDDLRESIECADLPLLLSLGGDICPEAILFRVKKHRVNKLKFIVGHGLNASNEIRTQITW